MSSLSSSEASSRVDAFVELTSSDEIAAQMFLQEHDWDLEKAVQSFFDKAEAKLADSGLEASTRPPRRLTLLSWNVDAMAEKNVAKRMDAVANEVQRTRADLVCLQELTSSSLDRLSRLLPRFQVLIQDRPLGLDYFTAVLVNRGTVYVDAFQCTEYESSRMGRALQCVQCHVGPTKIMLYNTHLESTKDHGSERIKQLNTCLGLLNNEEEEESNLVLTGDLNLRDKELEEVGGLPKGVLDMWSHMGAREECRFTWDAKRNTNIEMPGRFKPRCRFDRTLCRSSARHGLRPEHFGLVGLEKAPGTQVFPSDHWGILTVFGINEED